MNFSFQNFFHGVLFVCPPPPPVCMCVRVHIYKCVCVCTGMWMCGGPKCWHQCLSQSGFTFHSEAASLTEPILASLVISASPTSQLASGNLCIRAAWVLRRSQRSEPALEALFHSYLPWEHFIHWWMTAEPCHLPGPRSLFFLIVSEEGAIGTLNHAAISWREMTVSGPSLCPVCILLNYAHESV